MITDQNCTLILSKAIPITSQDSFSEAFESWISNRMMGETRKKGQAKYIGVQTAREYRQLAKSLNKVFSSTPLCDIGLDQIRDYERFRAAGCGPWTAPVGANFIRKEVTFLVRILRVAGVWTSQHELQFERMPSEESDIQRALNPDEQERFLMTAASSERWQYIYHYSIAALQTCMSTNELRTLKVGDVQLLQHTVQVRREGAKNRYRIRTIPIETEEAHKAFEALLWRANYLGSTSPEHYLFPKMGRDRRRYDPHECMGNTGLRKPWEEVRTAADLGWLRPYDLRHTAISRLAERGVAISTIMSLAGHMSVKMQQHYTTISTMAKREAIASVWKQSPPISVRPADRSVERKKSTTAIATSPKPTPESPATFQPWGSWTSTVSFTSFNSSLSETL